MKNRFFNEVDKILAGTMFAEKNVHILHNDMVHAPDCPDIPRLLRKKSSLPLWRNPYQPHEGEGDCMDEDEIYGVEVTWPVQQICRIAGKIEADEELKPDEYGDIASHPFCNPEDILEKVDEYEELEERYTRLHEVIEEAVKVTQAFQKSYEKNRDILVEITYNSGRYGTPGALTQFFESRVLGKNSESILLYVSKKDLKIWEKIENRSLDGGTPSVLTKISKARRIEKLNATQTDVLSKFYSDLNSLDKALEIAEHM